MCEEQCWTIESGIINALDALALPKSTRIGKVGAFLSCLAQKLISGERLSHVKQYDCDLGFGLFAGLNVPPKPTYTGNYSCLLSAEVCSELQKSIIARMRSCKLPSWFRIQRLIH